MQIYGHDVFAPVAMKNSLRTCLAYAAADDMEINKGDVKTAFLIPEIHEECYAILPEELITPGESKYVRLKKTIYGLKQAPKAWNTEINAFLMSIGLTRCTEDPCIYYVKNEIGKVIFMLALYVDDILLMGSKGLVKKYKNLFRDKYPFKDLGEARFILGLEISRNRKKRTVLLPQGAFIQNLLSDVGVAHVKP